MTKRIILAASLAVAALPATGCLARRFGRIEDHPAKNAMIIETMDQRIGPEIFLGGASLTHQFWLCEEKTPGSLDCSKTCGGATTDLQCPSVTYFNTGGYSNVR